MNFNLLPVELIDRILSELEPKELLLKCALVCKLWKSHLSQKFWMKKCQRDQILIPNCLSIGDDNETNFALIHLRRPYGRNLVQNPSGEEGIEHWKLTAVRPNLVVEMPPQGVEKSEDFPVCFAFTYTSIARSQRIDLIKCGCQPEILDLLKPRIIVSEWHSHRFDCTSTYKLICWLKSATGETLDKKSTECKAIGGHWEWYPFEFRDYPAGLRYIIILSEGVDNQYWAGHYGPKTAKASVELRF